MKRRLSVLLAILLISSVMFGLPISTSAEALYIRKIVSVVYDDSGSMDGDKAAYANYAMQSFCGMLNSEDRLFITYMSKVKQDASYTSEEIDLSADKIQSSVDAIRNHSGSYSTPYESVERAFDTLKNVNDGNPNTQYWLVVITDGEFDKTVSGGFDEKRLNENFGAYTEETMPNGSHPQVTFLGIGNVVSPTEDHNKGIYTYSASNATGIIGAMSDMADRISGRTRLQKSAVEQIDEKTIRVSSAIPLLNIAVFTQGVQAKISTAGYNGGPDIPISRNVSLGLNSKKYPSLVGGAFLLGDSQKVIDSGSYDITFDKAVDLEDVIILFEPALEARMTLSLNGKEVLDYRDLGDVMAGDKVSVSCKIYEMGTQKQIDPSLLPAGTKFGITVSEGGKVVEQKSGTEMTLSDYVLKTIETEITAAVTIEGFNPITCSTKFTPAEYVDRKVYTMSADYGSALKSVKFDDIASNRDMTICFTVYADGVAITDTDAVKALNPTIAVYPQGNDGSVTYSDDGKIIFTPNAASITTANDGSFQVDVTCTLENGVSATQIYTVLTATYEVIAVDAAEKVKRTELFGNETSVSFYITKDGVKLNKAAVEKQISVSLNEKHAQLKMNITVAPDGTITVTPYSEEEHVLTFWNWWTNWSYYFGLESADVFVTLSHDYGSAVGKIDIVGADTKYVLLCVFLPLLLEILLLAAIIAYIVRYFTKARFASNGVLYVGSITQNRGTPGTHRLELLEVHLNQFNRFQNLWNPFKELTVSANGVNITAAKGNRILCNENFPWYSDGIRPKTRTIKIDSPKDVVNYCQEKGELVIHEIKTVRVMDEQNRMISQDDSVYYFARADITYVKVGTKQTEVIDSAVAFCYSTIQN